MIRIAAIITFVVTAAPAVAQLAALTPSDRPALRREATVMSEIVRIGDLIDNAGAVADVAIFRAPDLGHTGSVSAAAVAEAVRSHHIVSLDTGGIGEVSVTRASRAITTKDFQARIMLALAGQHGLGEFKDLAVTFDHPVRTLQVEPGAGDLGVARLNFDPQTRRFDVALEIPGSAVARRVPMRFIGAVVETVETVIARRAFAPNEVIKAADVTVERRPKSEFAGAPAATIEDVLNFSAKRALQQGQPIRASDVMKPELVARNDSVTMVFEAPGILLSVRGKALEAGTLGDVVNVLNVESKRTVQATVSGPGRVTVTSASPRFAASQARKHTR